MAKSMDIIHPQDEEPKEQEEKSSENEDFEMEEPKGSSGTLYLVLGIVALVVASGITVYILFSDKSNENDANSAKPEPTVSEKVIEDAVESAVVSVQPSQTSTVSQSKNGTIRISNGNGINGEAKRIAELLKDDGFEVTSTGNATITYNETIIYYQKNNKELAEAIKEAIADEYKATIEESDKITAKFNTDAVIALGSK